MLNKTRKPYCLNQDNSLTASVEMIYPGCQKHGFHPHQEKQYLRYACMFNVENIMKSANKVKMKKNLEVIERPKWLQKYKKVQENAKNMALLRNIMLFLCIHYIN